MNVLLDTCALIALADGELPDAAADAVRHAPEAYVSIVSPWEVAIKVAGGKLRLMEPPVQWYLGLIDRYDLREAPLDAGIVCAAAALLAACGQRDSARVSGDEPGGSSIEPMEETPAPGADNTDTVPGTTTTPATPDASSEMPPAEPSTQPPPPDTTTPGE